MVSMDDRERKGGCLQREATLEKEDHGLIREKLAILKGR